MTIPAAWPKEEPRTTRLLHIDPSRDRFTDLKIGDLRHLLRANDLIVVNDAATLPASLSGITRRGDAVEARLTGQRDGERWRAVLFGAGDWRTRTEDRPPPPCLRPGDQIQFSGVRARVVAIDAESSRIADLEFDAEGDALWRALYRAGRPVQYAYVKKTLALWDVQTIYAARPAGAEAPSAGFALTWDLLLDLKRRGVAIARLTHSAGLSSTGDQRVDAQLPFAESYDIPVETVAAIEAARAKRGRILAIGTTVVRALEGAAENGDGRIKPGRGITTLRLGPRSRRHAVDGILSGVHDADTSHFSLLESFAPKSLLESAHAFAHTNGYAGHEFGDVLLVLGEVQSRGRTPAPSARARQEKMHPDVELASPRSSYP